MTDSDVNIDMHDIFYQLLGLGLREAAFKLSVMLNKSIDIKDPDIHKEHLKEVFTRINKNDAIYRYAYINYYADYSTETSNSERKNGLMLFVYSRADDTEFEILQTQYDGPPDLKTPEVVDSVIMETSNILSSAILKKLSDKSTIRINTTSPELYVNTPIELVDTTQKILKSADIHDEETIIMETAFLDNDKEVQLWLLMFAGDTFELLINQLIKSRTNW